MSGSGTFLLVTFWVLASAGLAGVLLYKRRKLKHRRQIKRPLTTQKLVFKSKSFQWSGDRFFVREGIPVLLVHGYSGTSDNWRDLALELARRDFDVWVPNLRGHGKGSQKSKALEGHKGSLGFREIVQEDIPTFIDTIYKRTGKKIAVVGHSLGGVALKAHVHALGSSKLRSLVVVGSPTQFSHFPAALKWLTEQFSEVAVIAQTLLPVPGEAGLEGRNNPLTKLRSGIKNRIIRQVDPRLLKSSLFHGVINTKNFHSTKELRLFLATGISKVHTDLIRDVTHWAKKGKIVDSHGNSYPFSGKIKIPVLFIAGDMDLLAHSQDVMNEAKDFSKYTLVRTILLKDTSHVDLIAGKRAADLLAKEIETFIRSPSRLIAHQELG